MTTVGDEFRKFSDEEFAKFFDSQHKGFDVEAYMIKQLCSHKRCGVTGKDCIVARYDRGCPFSMKDRYLAWLRMSSRPKTKQNTANKQQVSKSQIEQSKSMVGKKPQNNRQ